MSTRMFPRRSCSGGFTLIELIMTLLILGLAIYAIYHFLVQPASASGTSQGLVLGILKVLLIGVISAGGIYWQYYLIGEKDAQDGPRRMIYASIAALIFVGGIAVATAVGVFDDGRRVSLSTVLANSGKATVLGLAFLLKSYLAPIFAAFSLSCVVYFLLTYGELHSLPLVQALFDWVFSNAPKWVGGVYAVAVGVYSLVVSFTDSDIAFT